MRSILRGQVLAILPAWAIVVAPAQAANLIDHHQHLMSPQALSVFSAPKAITAADLIGEMDAAGIDRASSFPPRTDSPIPSKSRVRRVRPCTRGE